MNIIQLRFGAQALDNRKVLGSLKAGFSAYEHLNSDYLLRLGYGNGWFIDLFIGASPFAPQQEMITSTLLREGVAFDITFSPVGVDGDAVDTHYGLRRPSDEDIVWHDDAQSVDEGCDSASINLEALKALGIEVSRGDAGGEHFLYSNAHLNRLMDTDRRIVDRLAVSDAVDPLVRETAQYLLRSMELDVRIA